MQAWTFCVQAITDNCFHKGTDATIAQHIQTIIDRSYVIERMQGSTKYLVPSTLGIGLIEGYNQIGLAKSVSKPFLRREVSQMHLLYFSPHVVVLRQREGWSGSARAQPRNKKCLTKVWSNIRKCLSS